MVLHWNIKALLIKVQTNSIFLQSGQRQLTWEILFLQKQSFLESKYLWSVENEIADRLSSSYSLRTRKVLDTSKGQISLSYVDAHHCHFFQCTLDCYNQGRYISLPISSKLISLRRKLSRFCLISSVKATFLTFTMVSCWYIFDHAESSFTFICKACTDSSNSAFTTAFFNCHLVVNFFLLFLDF